MASPLADLASDLATTQTHLHAVLVTCEAEDWSRPTPSPGWTVEHQVRHLAHGEELAGLAATDPAAFGDELVRMLGDLDAVEAATTGPSAEAPDALLTRWSAAAEVVRSAVLAGAAQGRIDWVTGPMSRASFLTARVMETFAHGHDIGVALGRPVPAADALPHVAHLGVATRGFAFANRGLAVPEAPVRVELVGPAGEGLTWGPEDAIESVRGPALDFCLLVTQRIHRDDTALVAVGPGADAWLAIAQCFAGPPSDGPPPRRQ